MAGVLAADQFTKHLVVSTLSEDAAHPLIHGWLYISHIRNSGAAFSMFRGSGPILAVLAVIGILVLGYVIVKRPPRLVGYAAALVAGGALGNLIDRIVRGTVVDFVDFRGRWPAFNVADSAITIGVILLLLTSGKTSGDAPPESEHGPSVDPG